MRTMQNVMKRGIAWIAAVVIALTVGAFASTTQAYAVDPIASGDVAITKDFQMAPGMTCPIETFNFSITLQSVNGLDPVDSHDGGAIGNKKIDYTAADAGLTSTSRVKYVNGLFPAKTADNYFKHGGEYVYVIKEVGGSTAGITYNPEGSVYLMHVFVENDTLDITSVGTWTAKKGATFDEDGIYVDDKKVDGSTPTTSTTTGEITAHGQMIFKNIYTKTSTLDIKKVIAGKYADKTKLFDFSTTITIPSTNINDDEDQTFTAEIWKDGTKVADSTDVVFTVDAGATTSDEQTYKLTDGQYLHFKALPVGTKYVLSETGLSGTNYTPKAEVVGASAAPTITGTVNTNLDVTNANAGGQNVVVETADKSITTVTNTYKEVTPTGILIDNLPWILLVCAAGAGIVVFVVSRRNKKVHVA